MRHLAISNFHMTPCEIHATEDGAVMTFVGTGQFVQDLPRMTATGEDFVYHGVALLKMDTAGKNTVTEEYYGTTFAQTGVVSSDGGGATKVSAALSSEIGLARLHSVPSTVAFPSVNRTFECKLVKRLLLFLPDQAFAEPLKGPREQPGHVHLGHADPLRDLRLGHVVHEPQPKDLALTLG